MSETIWRYGLINRAFGPHRCSTNLHLLPILKYSASIDYLEIDALLKINDLKGSEPWHTLRIDGLIR